MLVTLVSGSLFKARWWITLIQGFGKAQTQPPSQNANASPRPPASTPSQGVKKIGFSLDLWNR